MMAQMRIMKLGPGHGNLLLMTGVEGKAARLGHALTLRVADWECATTFDGETPTAVELRMGLASLEVVSGEGGVKPLSDKDKRSILDNAQKTLKADRFGEVLFRSTAVQPAGAGWSLLGDLQLAGVNRQIAIDVTVAGGEAVSAATSILQSDHGISPYSQMLGALQVRDRVEVRLEVAVPRD